MIDFRTQKQGCESKRWLKNYLRRYSSHKNIDSICVEIFVKSNTKEIKDGIKDT